MARSDKAAAVAELTEAFRESAAVLTEYRGLTSPSSPSCAARSPPTRRTPS